MESKNTTQAKHPWRATARTVFAGAVGLAALMPAIVHASGAGETSSVVVGILAVSGGITRIMAVPGVNDFLTKFAPFLAAAPKTK